VDTQEFVVWVLMLGGLSTLTAIAVAFVLLMRSANSVRYLLFVALTGTSMLMRTGLVETLWPGVPPRLLELLQVCSGPLSAALVIRYMSIWLGGRQVDPAVHRIAVWGSGAMLLAVLVLGVLVFQVPPEQFYRLLRASAIVTGLAALVGLAAALRAAAMGDALARWVVLAAACLVVALAGLYVRSRGLPGFGLGTWIVTAACALGYLVLGSAAAILRIQEAQRLDRLARLQAGADPATDLPTGSVLLSEVEHAFWRAGRFNSVCTVVCLHLDNLYELGPTAGHGVEHQILAAMAARIRRAAGFRCIVGLYHPRCFVVVIPTDQRRLSIAPTVAHLRSLTAQPLTVVARDGKRHDFLPRVGIGVVAPDSARASPMEVIHAAERRALAPADAAHAQPVGEDTRPGERVADTRGAALQ
jgi:GGDEF domain-containing protein